MITRENFKSLKRFFTVHLIKKDFMAGMVFFVFLLVVFSGSTNSIQIDSDKVNSEVKPLAALAANNVVWASSKTSLTNEDPDAPESRQAHTAVWAGNKMIVWGGVNEGVYLHTGAIYNPVADTWVPTTDTGAPNGRYGHGAVWTGTEMIVWGGNTGSESGVHTGARYNPVTDSWTDMSTINAPEGRFWHSAVWTGERMVVWGGISSVTGMPTHTGGIYNPETDTWEDMSIVNAPVGRIYHSTVWTGTEMIVWGGDATSARVNTGARYNPETDTWTETSTVNAPEGRTGHSTVWTGSKMIVWGGYHDSLSNDGAQYNPVNDTWSVISTTGAPPARTFHSAIWTGSQMIVWGGSCSSGKGDLCYLRNGGVYKPSTDSWTVISSTGAPTSRSDSTAIWTGTGMLVWGGSNFTINFGNGGLLSVLALKPVYKFWSSTKTDHYYTSSLTERNRLINNYPNNVWRYQGIAFYAYTSNPSGTKPVYKFWSSTKTDHYYTSSLTERNRLINNYPNNVWQYQGVSFYVPQTSGTKPIYRFWSSTYGDHYYTASLSERNRLINNYPDKVWKYQGVAFYAP